jgi:voltage-gated potassium channel
MEQKQPTQRPIGRIVERRIEAKGRLTPRLAASLVAGFWLIAVVAFGVVERAVDPESFDTVWLAMWWALQTVTTVGYGDVVPDSTSGKIIASFLMLGGLSLFGVITGAITSLFVAQAQATQRLRADVDDPVVDRLDDLGAKLERLQQEITALRSSGPTDQ